jgi:hypothetical protein
LWQADDVENSRSADFKIHSSQVGKTRRRNNNILEPEVREELETLRLGTYWEGRGFHMKLSMCF